ncbi:MAG: peptidylprolyl isomerase [Prolixibacteraceae bacterium]|nr:peptidylprolyl isomerase [Prolixibacteraceae bacterium]
MHKKTLTHTKKTPFAINHSLFFSIVWFFTVSLSSVNSDDVLIVLQDREITKSEFLYFFHKNYTDSVGHNFDLFFEQYIDMHLKLAQARQEHFDNNIEFINDLTNFRIQLAAPYLTDNQKEEELAREAYDRLKSEVNASHVLIKIYGNDTLSAYNKAIQIRNKILDGEPFETVARDYSDDPNAKLNSGDLGYFSAFQSEYNFEKAVFEMNPGGLSMPVKSSMGYHIIQCRDKRRNQNFKDRLPSFEEMKGKLIELIKKPTDPRSEIIRESFTGKLKKEWNFQENRVALQTLLTPAHQTFDKVMGKRNPSLVLCTIDGKNLTAKDFFNYISEKDTTPDNSPVLIDIPTFYIRFVSDRLITYENFKLEDKYPEFRYQLWEYRDAMLLLEITKQQVWQKSISDSLELQKFYQKNIDKYVSSTKDEEMLPLNDTVSGLPDEVLSDYQFSIMKAWLEELKMKYKVHINQEVFMSVKNSLNY